MVAGCGFWGRFGEVQHSKSDVRGSLKEGKRAGKIQRCADDYSQVVENSTSLKADRT